MKVGYRRVSSVDQSLARQDLGDCERVFEEKLSGGSTDRPALQEMIAFVRSDDDVVIHSIDRLARNLMDLQSIIKELNDKGASVHLRNNCQLSRLKGMAFYLQATINCLFLRVGHAPPTPILVWIHSL